MLRVIADSERQLRRKTGFNGDAFARRLQFAQCPAAPWPGNIRDLQASSQRMAVLAERARITVAMVETEIATLKAQWTAAGADPDGDLLAEVLHDPGAIDLFDRVQLAAVIRVRRNATSLSAAGRQLFAASREGKTSQNDADRLRKYLSRFGLDWAGAVAKR